MEKLNIVFLIREDNRWEQLFSHIANLKKQPDDIDKIAVVIVNTAILSCLKSTRLDKLKAMVSDLKADNVTFYLCVNTLNRYGIQRDMILPEIEISDKGGLLTVARFEEMGYHVFTLA